MPIELKNDPERGVAVDGKSIYYSLGSPHWINLTGGPFAQFTYQYSKPSESTKNLEMATMAYARWGGGKDWYSALMRLDVTLGFGSYEQSIKVAKGGGVTTAFYLSQYDEVKKDRLDKEQEIDLELSGGDTKQLQATMWKKQTQDTRKVVPLPQDTRPGRVTDVTSGWGPDVYRYKILWEPNLVTWSVDLTGSGNNYVVIRNLDVPKDFDYKESLCYPYMSVWGPWTFDGSKFLEGADAPTKCGESGPCYQAFFFQPLKFTKSDQNRLVTLVR